MWSLIIKNKRYVALVTTLMAGVLWSSNASAKEFSSRDVKTNVIELYTSEGCSSCPPADRWLSSLKQRPGLFETFIPMAFHVDYWNYLGWRDRFSNERHSARQRSHVMSGHARQTYTPQVLAASQEFLQWRQNAPFPVASESVGILKANLINDNRVMNVSWQPVKGGQRKDLLAEFLPDNVQHQIVLNVAVLGMNLQTQVKSGENAGRQLRHDFVVLEHMQQPVSSSSNQWQLAVPAIPQMGQQQTAIVVWLSDLLTQEVIQATGGIL